MHRLRARAAKSAIKIYNSIPREVENQVRHILDERERANEYEKLVGAKRKEIIENAKSILTLIPTNAPSPEGKDLDVLSMKISEAEELDSVSLPSWLKPDESLEESFDDPYLTFEDAFLKNKDKNPEEDLFSDNEDDTFLSNKRVLT